MNSYTVFEPDDDSLLFYVWRGGLTVNVYSRTPNARPYYDSDLLDQAGENIDVFTMAGLRTTRGAVEAAIERYHKANT